MWLLIQMSGVFDFQAAVQMREFLQELIKGVLQGFDNAAKGWTVDVKWEDPETIAEGLRDDPVRRSCRPKTTVI